jgi:hypothetical protein
MALISQISQLGQRGQVLLSMILAQIQVLRVAEFRLDSSTHLHTADKHTKTGTAARAEGDAAKRDAQVPSTEAKTHALYTREVSIDKLRKQDQLLGLGAESQRLFADRRMDQNVIELAQEVQDHIFAGTLTNDQMLGLLTFIVDGNAAAQTSRLGFTTAELAAMNKQVALQINTTANQDQFIEILEEEIANVPGANAIMVNTKLGARFSTIARRLGLTSMTKDNFGFPLETYRDIPIVRVPTTAISNTQSDGVNNDCTSLVVARFAESQGVCLSTNTGLLYQDFGEVEDAPANVARADMYVSLTVEKANAVKRLSRIRL